MKYYIVWVEGFEPRRGEKIKRFREDGSIEYTLLLTKAMRVKQDDLITVADKMRKHGVAQWVLDSHNTFIKTSYAPTGTIFKS